MRKSALIGSMAALLLGSVRAYAGPWEDGMVAYNRGGYVPAIRLFRPLAEAGNPKAQNQIGLMYRKGEGGAAEPGPRLHVVQPCRQTRRGQGQGRPARRFQKHDAGGNLAGPADGAGVRGFQLPRLRILIAVTASGASGPH